MKTWLLAAAAALTLGLAPLGAAEIGDDGLHKPDWLRLTFNDMAEDLDEARAEGKRLMLIFEQRGCIYCRKMHTEVFSQPEIQRLLREEYFVVQMNLFGDEEVVDLDGTAGAEKEMARRWGVVFTPTMIFLPEEAPEGATVSQAAVVTMPGAFEKGTTYNLLNWVLEHGYEGEEHFQAYHARKLQEAAAAPVE